MEERHIPELCPNGIYIEQILERLSKVETDHADTREKMIISEEKTSQIFILIGKMEKNIDGILATLQKMAVNNAKPTPFNEWVQSLGLKALELAVFAGIVIYALAQIKGQV